MKIPGKIKGWPNLPARVEELREFLVRHHILDGDGYNLDEGPDGTQIIPEPGIDVPLAAGVSPFVHPFRTEWRRGATEGTYQRRVAYRSALLQDPLAGGGALAITGLSTADVVSWEGDAGVANLDLPDLIWLEVNFIDTISAAIKSWGTGGSWDGVATAEWDGEDNPTVVRCVIAEFISQAAGPRMVQGVFTNLALWTTAPNGKIIKMLFPWSGLYASGA